jgi:pantoate kinase
MSSPALEEFLARLYTDEPALAEFLRMPSKTARAAGLNDAEVSSLVHADHIGLVMAAASYCAKRERRKSRHRLSLWRRR